MPKYNIAVGIITGNSMVHQGLVASFMEIASECTEFKFMPIFADSIYVCRNRNTVAGLFTKDHLCADADFLLMLDADNGITPEGLRFFMEDFEDPEVNIVTGKYMFKTEDNDMMVGGYCPPHSAPYFYSNFNKNTFTKDVINVTQEVGRAVVGCGCLMVRRKVFEVAPWPWFKVDWVTNKDGATHMIGEDLYFSYHVQDHGFDIHLDQRIKSPHYAGNKCFPPEWSQYDFFSEPPEEMEGLTHLVIKPLDEQTTKED